MSWKTSGRLLSGPPSANHTDAASDPSNFSASVGSRLKPNLGGLTAFQREQQLAARYGDYARVPEGPMRSEWDVLRENHRFIRDDEEPENVSWEERLARAYESKLFKEFALIDLKHYKSRRLALRWRTAEEVVNGIGEDTCASLRCKYHKPLFVSPHVAPAVGFDDDDDEREYHTRRSDEESGRSSRSRHKRKGRRERNIPPLRTFELPFVYEEAGGKKEALVKVKLCPKCQAKLVWKPEERVSKDTDDDGQERKRERSRAREVDGNRYEKHCGRRLEDDDRGSDDELRQRRRQRREEDGQPPRRSKSPDAKEGGRGDRRDHRR